MTTPTYYDSAARKYFVDTYCITDSGDPLKNGNLIFEIMFAAGQLIYVPKGKRRGPSGRRAQLAHYKMRDIKTFPRYQRMAKEARDDVKDTYLLGTHADLVVDELVRGDRLIAVHDGDPIVLKLRGDTIDREDGDSY